MKTTTKQAILGGALVLAALLALSACGGDDSHTHDWKWEVTTPATYTKEGVETEKCSGCNETRDTRPIAKLPVTNIDNLETFLAAQTGGDTEDDPIILTITLNLGDMDDDSGWQELLAAIETAGKYVTLDLSASTMTDTEFNPYSDTPCGEELITAIILPDTATKIADGVAGTWNGSSFDGQIITFGNFTSLTSASGVGITDVGDLAFSGRTLLESVNLPKAENIGAWAFEDCTALESVNLPVAESIGITAFVYCTALESISLPSAESIEVGAFWNCTALESVSLPSATSIGAITFGICTALESVTLGANAPTVGTDLFSGITEPQTVTVYIPSNATGYGASPTNTTDNNWGNAFRGKGWDGTDYLTGPVNANITLVIVYGE